MARKRKQDDPLAALLETAPKAKLVDLLVRVAATRPDVHRECFDYLKKHATRTPSQQQQSEGEKLLTLWAELAPDLDELDAYGGDYDADFHVSSLLQAIGHLTCDKYKAFRKLCTAAEWRHYEVKILAQSENTWNTEQLRIRMHRKEYEEAVAVLTRSRYPLYAWDSAYELQTAKRLEGKYPEAILKYYLSGLGNLKTNAPRKEYTRKAQVMKKVHRVLVDVLRDAPRWRDFSIKIKRDNIKRPAFQEEFAKAVPGWQALK